MCQTGTSCEAFLKKQHRTVNSKNRRTDGSRPVFTSSFCMRNGICVGASFTITQPNKRKLNLTSQYREEG